MTREGRSRICSSWSSLAIAYIEMPEENTVMSANETALNGAGLLVEAEPEVFRDRAGREP